MKYIEDKDGQVKVREENGNDKYIMKHLAQDSMLMKAMKLTVVEAPVVFDGLLCDEVKSINETEEITEDVIEENETVAEVTTAKRGRKPNK